MAGRSETVVACPDCDLLQRLLPLPPGGRARCPRCGKVVAADKPSSLDRTLAFAVAAAIVFLIAHVMPLMRLSAVGKTVTTTILGGAEQMWLDGERVTALIVGFCVFVAPAVQIGLTLAVLLGARRRPSPPWVGTLLRWSERHEPWAMVEVMMLGVLVALVKIAQLAEVLPGVGMFAIGVLIFLLAKMAVSFDPEEVWESVRWASRPREEMR